MSFIIKLLIIFQFLTFAESLDWFFEPNLKPGKDNSELIRTHSKFFSSTFTAKSEDGDAHLNNNSNEHKIRGRNLNQLSYSKNSRISRQLSYNFQPFDNFNGFSRSFPFQSPSNTFCKTSPQNLVTILMLVYFSS